MVYKFETQTGTLEVTRLEEVNKVQLESITPEGDRAVILMGVSQLYDLIGSLHSIKGKMKMLTL